MGKCTSILGTTSVPRQVIRILKGNKQMKIAEPVQNECEVSLAMMAVLWPKAGIKALPIKLVVIASAARQSSIFRETKAICCKAREFYRR